MLSCAAAASAQSVSGLWCQEAVPAHCILLTQAAKTTEIISADLQASGKTYALASGYFQDGRLSLAFRRVDTREIGFMTFITKGADTADARTFNPDGSPRWRGVYRRQGR